MDGFKYRKIIELPRHVADKIAAGEVVDRPLSIVKELVENAIDAGSDTIIVEIKNGGKNYIRITDNGCGIEKNDTELAFRRHATSKIKTASDLDRITSLGFRGEALASIAAVSRTELITKTADERSGIRIKIDGGEIIEKTDTGCPNGTTVIIQDLFYNTPARLKFMKPDATESTLIIDFISKMSLAYPDIKIRLINNGSILFSTSGKGDIYSNILTIYSRDIGERLIHLKEDGQEMLLEAYISDPGYSKSNRKSQIFFVNGRNISSKLLENAISEAYAEKLFDGRYPVIFLFLKVAPDKLDVNIHPNKKEVRFDDEKAVKEFVAASIRKSLNTGESISEIKSENIFKINKEQPEENRSSEKSEKQVDIKNILSTERQKEQKQQEDFSEIKPVQSMTLLDQVMESQETYRAELYPKEAVHLVEKDFDINDIEITGSIFGTYITGVDESSFYLLDQHAAHERVFYEKILDQYNQEEKKQQTIMVPLIKNVSYAIKNETQGMLDFLGKMGFQIEEFGPKAYIVKAIPMFMEFEQAEDFLDYLLDNISEGSDLKNQKKIDAIITNACKQAVKAHDLLDRKEIDQLVADLAKTKNPYSCPHGRPTFIKLTKYEIEKMFKRV